MGWKFESSWWKKWIIKKIDEWFVGIISCVWRKNLKLWFVT